MIFRYELINTAVFIYCNFEVMLARCEHAKKKSQISYLFRPPLPKLNDIKLSSGPIHEPKIPNLICTTSAKYISPYPFPNND